MLAVTAGHTDGHHSHVDVGSFVYHIDGESLIPDAGRGKYAKDYFRQQRYDNIFNNAYAHNIPRIGGQMEQPGPEFGGHKQYHGTIVDHGERERREIRGRGLPDRLRSARTDARPPHADAQPADRRGDHPRLVQLRGRAAAD